MNQPARPARVRRRRRDRRRTAIVVALGAALALGLLGANEILTARQQAALAAAAPSDAEVYTGSILFYVLDEGSTCRQILFDNRTGRLADNGNVDCERAAYRGLGGTPMQLSAARVRVISTGFRQH
jgi:hypothetical protein